MKSKIKVPDKKKELSELSKRFLDILKIKNYTGYKLAKEVSEITESKITFIRSGRNEPSKNIIDALLQKFPDISKVWLLTGEGEMLKENEKISILSEPSEDYGLKVENLKLKNELIEKKAIITYLESKIASCNCLKKQQTA